MMLVSLREANWILARHHYLGPIHRGFALRDECGVLVLANPSSRRLPISWLELSRWCITAPAKNAGSAQWSAVARWLREHRSETTVVSYSDPSQGHTGALYKASGWWWAPTWHRLRPPPSGNGRWSDAKSEAVKDRWIFPLRRDAEREGFLIHCDESIARANPGSLYREPGGVDWKRWQGR
jgi:hypothetical protein